MPLPKSRLKTLEREVSRCHAEIRSLKTELRREQRVRVRNEQLAGIVADNLRTVISHIDRVSPKRRTRLPSK
jgi:hypothetical protein